MKYKQNISNRMVELLSRDTALCVAINGRWGVGKTYFWNDFVEKKSQSKSIAYISLFGKENIETIRREIILQISKKDKIISGLKSGLKDFKTSVGMDEKAFSMGISGSVISSFMSILQKKDFTDVVVCFDDFERISDKLNIKDVFGLMSELKEQKNCHVVMIFNSEKLDEDSCLSEYKDKVIDYELEYSPSSDESFELVKDELNAFENYALKFFHKFEINNVRIMKRVINALNDYSFIENTFDKQNGLEVEVISLILAMSYINAISQVNFE